MTEPTATLWAATRRDAILLTGIAIAVATWGWAQEAPLVLAAGVLCAFLYVATTTVVRQGQRLETTELPLAGKGVTLLWSILELLTGSATVILLTWATFTGFGRLVLAIAVAVLVAAWQAWFYFWMGD